MKDLLESIVRRQTASQSLVRRATIILNLYQSENNQQVATRLYLYRETVRTWRQRWLDAFPTLLAAEKEGTSDKELLLLLENALSDKYRLGAPVTFTAEQIVMIVAVACENPLDSQRSITHWTARELADEVIKRGIVTKISPRQVKRFLDEADLKPHLSRYWLNPRHDDPEKFAEEVEAVCELDEKAPSLYEKGTIVASTDEKTSIQALERLAETKPTRPGLVDVNLNISDMELFA